MKTRFYIDCADEQLIRAKEEERQIKAASNRQNSTRFRQHNPFEVISKIIPETPFLPYPILLSLHLDGQIIVSSDVEIGWQHQGIEKVLENTLWENILEVIKKVTPGTFSPLVMGCQIACEKLEPKRNVPIYQKYQRIAGLEAQRILENWEIVSRVTDLTFDRLDPKRLSEVRKKTMDLVLALDQNMIHATNRLASLDALKTLKNTIVPILEAVHRSSQVYARLQGKAKITERTAISLGLSGIYLRACGLPTDVRINHTDLPYSMLGFEPQTDNGKDAYSRFILRLREIDCSLALIEKAIKVCSQEASSLSVDHGLAVETETLRPSKGQEATSFIEGSEGEFVVSVCSDGGNTPYRVRLRTPSFSLTAAISTFLAGCHIDDVVLILSTLGINTLETDR